MKKKDCSEFNNIIRSGKELEERTNEQRMKESMAPYEAGCVFKYDERGWVNSE